MFGKLINRTYAADTVVPTKFTAAVGLEIHATRTLAPGPHTSTTDPKFEVESLEPPTVRAPTVTAARTQAGLIVPASVLESPAATTKWMPLLMAVLTALSRGAYPEMTTVKIAIDERPDDAEVIMIQLMSSIISETYAEPSSPNAIGHLG